MAPLDPKLQQILVLIIAALGGLTLLTDGVVIIVWLFSKDREERGEPPLIAPFWSVAHAFFLVQIGFLLANACYLIVMFISAFLRFQGSLLATLSDRVTLLVGLIGQNVILAGLPIALIVRFYKSPVSEIGLTLRNQPLRRLIVLGILASVPVMGLSFILEQAMNYVARLPSLQTLKSLQDAMSKMVTDLIHPGQPLGMFLFAFLVIAIIGPAGEEILFRGYLYTVIKKRFNMAAAVVVSAFLFAAIHGQPLALLPIFAIGVALALLYEYTGSLLPCIVLHVVNNGTMAFLLYLQSAKH